MAHLLRHTLKINAQRIIDTPPLYFQLTPCIYTLYFQKRLFQKNNQKIYFQKHSFSFVLQTTYIPLLKFTCR